MERGRIHCPLTRTALQSIGLPHLVDRLQVLDGLDARAVAAAIGVAIAERAERSSPRLELVWTGPERASSQTRDTAVVLRRLFGSALRQVLIAGYSFDSGGRLLEPLWVVMRDRGVLTRLIFQVEPEETLGAEIAAELAAARFISRNWPFGPPMPELWYDPRTVVAGSTVSMHAKCVVVDEAWSLLGSANFTDRGQQRNIEAGVLIEDRPFARKLHQQWNGLMEADLLRRVR